MVAQTEELIVLFEAPISYQSVVIENHKLNLLHLSCSTNRDSFSRQYLSHEKNMQIFEVVEYFINESGRFVKCNVKYDALYYELYCLSTFITCIYVLCGLNFVTVCVSVFCIG